MGYNLDKIFMRYYFFSLQSHAFNKARWVGVCPNVQPNILVQAPQLVNANISNVTTGNTNQVSCGTTQRILAQELRARLEQLSQS